MTFLLNILTPTVELFQDHVNSVQVPAVDGMYELLPDHAPIFIALQAGAVTVHTSIKTESWFVEGGTCHMQNNQCVFTLKGIIDMTGITKESLVAALKQNAGANFSPETRQLLEAQLAYKNTL
jgi:F-type H+-transporting ATPase subunit epsilon